jgi:hypothetical protein
LASLVSNLARLEFGSRHVNMDTKKEEFNFPSVVHEFKRNY